MTSPLSRTGIIYDIQGFSIHDGPGIRTTVFMKGCPLRCLWCHSPESISSEFELSWFEKKCIGVALCGKCQEICPHPKTDSPVPDRELCTACLKCTSVCPTKARFPSGREISIKEIFDQANKDRHFFGDTGGLTISGGEPMQQFDFVLELAKLFYENKISVCLDTTGHAPTELYLKILPYIDMFLYDIKHMDSLSMEKLTGVPNELIIKNAEEIARHGGKFQIRVPIIPKLNDDDENMRLTAEFCAGLGAAVVDFQLLPYHKLGGVKYTRLGKEYSLNIDPPTDEHMQELLKFMLSYGLPAHIH